MLLLSFLVEVLFTLPLPMSFPAIVETCSFVTAKGYLPLLVGPTNKEVLGLFFLKVPSAVVSLFSS